MSETIEERYAEILELAEGPYANVTGPCILLIDDLMAEREIVREQYADYDEMIRREKERRNPDYQKSLPTVDEVTGILKED